MRRSGRLFIVLGVALALVAGLLAVMALTGGEDDDITASAEQSEPVEITVITAARDVPAHERITEDDLQEQVVDAATVSGDVVTSRIEVIGLAYTQDLTAGQALLRAQLETPGLANRIEPGRRAFALPVDVAGMVGGLVRDDDHLDLIFTSRVDLLRVNPSVPLEAFDRLEIDGIEDEEGGNGLVLPRPGEDFGPTYPYPGEDGSRFWISDLESGDPVTKVILQNVRVLRTIVPTTTETSGSTTTGSFLVLDVSPEEAEILRFMMMTGTYQIVLRGLDDDDVAGTNGVTFNQMVDDLDLPVPKTVRLPAAGAQ